MKEEGLYDYVIVNESVDEAFRQLQSVATRALAGRTGHQAGAGGPLTLVAKDTVPTPQVTLHSYTRQINKSSSSGLATNYNACQRLHALRASARALVTNDQCLYSKCSCKSPHASLQASFAGLEIDRMQVTEGKEETAPLLEPSPPAGTKSHQASTAAVPAASPSPPAAAAQPAKDTSAAADVVADPEPQTAVPYPPGMERCA